LAPLTEITATAVEEWLGSLPLANSTKAKLRNQLSALFNHAIRHKHWKEFNPITGPSKGSGVRQSAKRAKTPDILGLLEMQAIVFEIRSEPIRLAVMIAAVTGLRRSEIRGLKWKDIDFDGLWLRIKRGKIGVIESRLKTEASRRPVPMPLELADMLVNWRSNAMHRDDDDWVFASETNNGREPMWFDIALKRQILPAAERAGIKKQIGWHTWRRSLATLLATKKENVKVVQELLRHANSKITLELYQQADEGAKREAQKHTASLFVVDRAF
jgi:integrase